MTYSIKAQLTFQKSYGLPDRSSEANDVLEIPGGFLIAGGAFHPVTSWDGLLMQLNTSGNVVWEKTYDLDGIEKFKSIISASDGGYILLGESQTEADIWVLKVDATGNIDWQFRISQPNGGLTGTRLVSVPDGFVLSGTTGANNGLSFGYLARVGANAQITWARTYQTASNNILTLGALTDSLWYASGIVGNNASIIAVDPLSGGLQKSINFSAQGAKTLDYMVPTPDGNFILYGWANPFWPVNFSYSPWIQKISPAGEVIWSNIYHVEGQSNLNGPLIAIPGGGYLVCAGSGSNAPTQDAFLMKISEEGSVSWCHPYGNPNRHDWFLKALPTSDGGFIAVGLTGTPIPGRSNIYVVKLNANGQLLDCCQENIAVSLENFSTSPLDITFTPGPFYPKSPATGVSAVGNSPAQTMLCTHPVPVLEVQQSLCPGQTTLLNGEVYTAPDTVLVPIPGVAGDCDTLATYYLLDANAGQPNLMQFQCPANITLTLPAGASSQQVDYDLPIASTNCTCDGLVVSHLSGGLSGSLFPVGNHQICWRATDACGNDKSCCLNITINEDTSPCDEKSSGCFTWELLDRAITATDEVAYRFRLTNHCASGLKYAWFEVPSGFSALEPPQNSLYATTPIRQYQVRNPNFSPFYGVRFQALSSGLQSGQSEIFRVVLPKQCSPDYLLAAAKLENGVYAEAHLNSSDCPLGQEKNSTSRHVVTLEQPTRFSVSPNPASGATNLEFELNVAGLVLAEFRDLQGKVVKKEALGAFEEGHHRRGVSTNELPTGIYILSLQGPLERRYVKLAVQH
jgi:hypothetical protein